MDIAINQSFEASGSIGQFIVPNGRTDQIIATGQTDEFKTSALAEDCGLKIPAAHRTKDDTRTVRDALSVAEDHLSLKTMSRVDLDVPDVHDFLISRGGTLGGRSLLRRQMLYPAELGARILQYDASLQILAAPACGACLAEAANRNACARRFLRARRQLRISPVACRVADA
jgi:hypothetical protein